MGKDRDENEVEEIDAWSVYMQALRFEYAADLLSNHALSLTLARKNRGLPPAPFEELPPTMLPYVVNAAFAVELYFKTIIALEGDRKRQRGHNLIELWGKIKKPTQDAMLHAYEAAVEASPELKHLRDRASDKTPFGLVAMLMRHKDLFSTVRYAYEKKMIEVASFKAVLLAVVPVIEHLNPEWKGYASSLGLPPTFPTP